MTTAEIANIALALATLALVIGSIALARTAPKASTDSSAEPRELTQAELDMINGQQGRYSTNADGTIKPRRPRKQRTPKKREHRHDHVQHARGPTATPAPTADGSARHSRRERRHHH